MPLVIQKSTAFTRLKYEPIPFIRNKFHNRRRLLPARLRLHSGRLIESPPRQLSALFLTRTSGKSRPFRAGMKARLLESPAPQYTSESYRLERLRKMLQNSLETIDCFPIDSDESPGNPSGESFVKIHP